MSKEKSKVAVRRQKKSAASPVADGWGALTSLRTEIDRMFDDFGAGFWRHPMPDRGQSLSLAGGHRHVLPAVDLVECDGEFRMTSELPGIAPDSIEIKLGEGMIDIRGEKSEDRREKKQDYLLSERRYGAFHRALSLPPGVDGDAVSASFSNGVLTVTLPKSVDAKKKERKVEVKAA